MALRIGLNTTGVPEDEAAQLDAASTDPGRRPASGACHAFPRDTTPLDSTNLPTRAAGYPLSLSSRPPANGTACLSAGGATAIVIRAPDRHGNPNADRPLAPSSTAIQRRLGAFTHRDRHRGHLYPNCLPLDVSVHLGTLAKWEGAPRPNELAVAALPRVDPPSTTPRRRTGRGPGPVTHVQRRLDAEGARALVEDCPNLKRGLSLLSRAKRRQCSIEVVEKPVSRSAALAVVAVTVAAFLFRRRQTGSE